MKYVFGIILGLFLVSCQTQESVQFKNPIFNKKLEAISKILNDVKITPTEIIDLKDPEVLPATCELLSDEGYRIIMKCVQPYRTIPVQTVYYRFTNMGKYEPFYSSEKNLCEIHQEQCDDMDFQNFYSWGVFVVRLNDGEDCGLQVPEDQLPEWLIR